MGVRGKITEESDFHEKSDWQEKENQECHDPKGIEEMIWKEAELEVGQQRSTFE